MSASPARRCLERMFLMWSLGNDPPAREYYSQSTLSGGITPDTCGPLLVAKAVGFAILLSSCTLKLPQIRRILATRSTTGLSTSSIYFEAGMYLNAVMYNLLRGNPVTAFGETMIVLAQNVVVVLLLWRFQPPGVLHLMLVVGAFSGYVFFAMQLSYDTLPVLMAGALPIMLATRIPQMWTNITNRHTGVLSWTTVLMNALTSVVRVFTTLVEVGVDGPILRAYGLSIFTNVVLLVQIWWYRKATAEVMSKRR